MRVGATRAGYGRSHMTLVLGLFSSLASVIRFAEPWDIAFGDDPLLDRSSVDEPGGIWS